MAVEGRAEEPKNGAREGTGDRRKKRLESQERQQRARTWER